MLKICLISGLSLILIAAGFCFLNRRGKLGKGNEISLEAHYVVWVLIIAFLFRAVLSAVNGGHSYDIGCFLGWSSHLYSEGIENFYSGDFFADYPPGYLYVLYVIGWLRSILGLTGRDGLSLFLIKMPAVFCDILTGYFIYRSVKGKMPFTGVLFCMAVYLFHPAVYINSAIWGQVDSVYTLMVLLLLWGIGKGEGKVRILGRTFKFKGALPLSYAVFGAGILIKPQMLFFAPILILAIIDKVMLNDFSWKRFFIHLLCGIAAIAGMFLLAMPFGLDLVISQYMETIASYPYATVNAYNFWCMLGFNWSLETQAFLGLSIAKWGKIFIICACVLIFIIWLKEKKRDSSFYYFLAGTLMFLLFTFSAHMHERYLFPSVVLYFLAFIKGKRKLDFAVFAALGTLLYLNTAHVLYYYDPHNFSRRAVFPVLVGTVTFLIAVLVVIYSFFRDRAQICKSDGADGREDAISLISENSKEVIAANVSEDGMKNPKKNKKKAGRFQRQEWLFILILTAIYGFIAFYDLGDMSAPQSFYIKEKDDETKDIVLDLGEVTEIGAVSWYLGGYEDRNFFLEASNDGEHFYIEDEILMERVFRWSKHDIGGEENSGKVISCRYIRLTAKEDRFSIGEIVLLDGVGNRVMPLNASDYPELFDESSLYPSEFTYRNGTYFDEIYHARTAYEYIHGLYSYENTHPPLGKIFIALGIKIFGMCPFGWRFMGTLFGVLMVPVFYLFVRKVLFPRRFLAMTATVLFTFDFMHFTQTRIATIDVFVTFFIMLAFYFMYEYATMDFFETGLKPTLLPLGLSGLFMALAIASKWTGIYAAMGLAVIFFGIMFLRTREYKYAKKSLKERNCRENITLTLSFCLIFFVLVPIIVYTLSYIPFRDRRDWSFIPAMLRNQKIMFNYHSGLESTHYYSSRWYQWPVIFKPMLYYSRQRLSGLSEGISAMGNPLIWWMGISAFIYMVYLGIGKKDKTAVFLFIGYLAQYVPWMFIKRTTYIYHYFPSVPFVVLMISYAAKQMESKEKAIKWIWLIYVIMAVALFAMFYPVISGMPVSDGYVSHFLRWFDSWVLLL